MIWKIWKKDKQNSEKIWGIQKKGKLNSEMILTLQEKIVKKTGKIQKKIKLLKKLKLNIEKIWKNMEERQVEQ